MDDNLVRSLPKKYRSGLNGYRDVVEMLRLVTEHLGTERFEDFKLALLVIKLWAKRRGVYSSNLTFLGGMAYAIMLAKVCLEIPCTDAQMMFHHFFDMFSKWEWPNEVSLVEVEREVWCTKYQEHCMPIITLAEQQENLALKVTRSSCRIIQAELQRGLEMTKEQNWTSWVQLFEVNTRATFFDKYQHFVALSVSSSSAPDQVVWRGYLESKVRVLARDLESKEGVELVHVNTEIFPKQPSTPPTITETWFVGLKLRNNSTNLLNLLCSCTVQYKYKVQGEYKKKKFVRETMKFEVELINKQKFDVEYRPKIELEESNVTGCDFGPRTFRSLFDMGNSSISEVNSSTSGRNRMFHGDADSHTENSLSGENSNILMRNNNFPEDTNPSRQTNLFRGNSNRSRRNNRFHRNTNTSGRNQNSQGTTNSIRRNDNLRGHANSHRQNNFSRENSNRSRRNNRFHGNTNTSGRNLNIQGDSNSIRRNNNNHPRQNNLSRENPNRARRNNFNRNLRRNRRRRQQSRGGPSRHD